MSTLGKSIGILVSLLLLFLLQPLLADGSVAEIVLDLLMFTPLVFATIKLSHKKLLWPLVLLIAGAVGTGIAAQVFESRVLFTIQFSILTIAFWLAVVELFSYLRRASVITAEHLFAAASIYLLLAIAFFSLYMAITGIEPNAFQSAAGPTHQSADLLYFSLATLTTLGYGDIVPVGREARILAGLEAATGVLYVAITVALLVSAYTVRPGNGARP